MVAVFILLLLQQFRNLTIVCLANEMQDMLNTTKEAHLGEQVVLKKAVIAHELAKLAIDLMNSSSGVGGAPVPPLSDRRPLLLHLPWKSLLGRARCIQVQEC